MRERESEKEAIFEESSLKISDWWKTYTQSYTE